MRKVLLWAVAFSVLICPLFLGAQTLNSTVVTFRSWSPVVATTDKMIKAFEAKNPDITIEATIFNYPEYIVDLETRVASNTLPDIIGLEPGALTQQYKAVLQPVQDLVVKNWGKNWKNSFYPIGLDQARLGNPSGDTNYYGLPVLVQTINCWYTIPVLRDAGLKPPKTYDDLLKMRDVLKSKGIAVMLVGAGDGWLRRDVYMQLIHNIAPGLIYKAEEGTVKFTAAPFVEAMRIWKKLFDDQIIQPGALGLSAYPGAQELIEAGRAAVFPMGAWWMQMAGNPNPPPLSKGFVGFAPMKFPDVTGKGSPDDLLGGIDVMLGVTKSAKNVDATMKVFCDFIKGDAAQQLVNTFNDIPAVKGLQPQDQYFETPNQRQVWKTLTEDWMLKVKYPRQLRSPAVKQALEDALAGVAAGEVTPEKAMENVQLAWKPLQ